MKTLLCAIFCLTIVIAARAADDTTVVARIHGNEITAGEIGLKFKSDGEPVIPTDKATCLVTNPVAELGKRVKQKMQSETVRARNLVATEEELRDIAEFIERSMAADRVRRRKDLAKFEQELADGRLSTQEQERTAKRVETLRRLADHDKRLETMPKPTPEMMRMIHAPLVEGWKYHQAIYTEYGGTVASTKFGPDPVGAKAAMAEKLEQEGTLQITVPALREAFWQSMREAPRFVLEPGKVDFTPFWKMPLPQDREPDSPATVERAAPISRSDAVKIAEKFAGKMNVPIETRTANVAERDGLFTITYEPQPNERGGAWIFKVDAATGEVQDAKIHR